MAAASQHLPVESAVIPSPETTPTANIQAAADVPSPPSPKPSTSNADFNHNTDLDDEIVGEIDELMHEPREDVAMEAGAFGSHAPAQGLSEAALNELRAKNVNFVTSMKSKSSLRRTENTVQRLTKWLRQKGEMRSLKKSLERVLISSWPCGFLTPGSHQAKSMNLTRWVPIFRP